MNDRWLELLFFGVCAVMAVVGAIGTVAFPNPIRGALSLLFSIVAIAGVYLQLHAPFLAAAQLIVYAGAVVVLFIFVIMLIGPEATPAHDSRGLVPRILGGLAMSAISLVVLTVMARKAYFFYEQVGSKTVRVAQPVAQSGFGSIDSFGDVLFSTYLVPFEVASFLLMVAIVGAVAVARGKQPERAQKQLKSTTESEVRP